MGHPPGAVWLPSPAHARLAADVERVAAWHGAPPSALVALLRGEPGAEPAQLAVLAFVLDPDRRHVLLVQHRHFGWSCPGGHVEAGEDPVAAVARELEEETGLAQPPDDAHPITVSYAVAPATDDGPAHHHWLLGYRFTAGTNAPLRPERDPVAWHPVDALPAGGPDDLAALLPMVIAR